MVQRIYGKAIGISYLRSTVYVHWCTDNYLISICIDVSINVGKLTYCMTLIFRCLSFIDVHVIFMLSKRSYCKPIMINYLQSISVDISKQISLFLSSWVSSNDQTPGVHDVGKTLSNLYFYPMRKEIQRNSQ